MGGSRAAGVAEVCGHRPASLRDAAKWRVRSDEAQRRSFFPSPRSPGGRALMRPSLYAAPCRSGRGTERSSPQTRLPAHGSEGAPRHFVSGMPADRDATGLDRVLELPMAPSDATRRQPSSSIRRMTSRTFTATPDHGYPGRSVASRGASRARRWSATAAVTRPLSYLRSECITSLRNRFDI